MSGSGVGSGSGFGFGLGLGFGVGFGCGVGFGSMSLLLTVIFPPALTGKIGIDGIRALAVPRPRFAVAVPRDTSVAAKAAVAIAIIDKHVTLLHTVFSIFRMKNPPFYL